MAYVPPNDAEKQQMDAVMQAFIDKNEAFKKLHKGASYPGMSPILDTTTEPGATLYEIGVEVITRKAKNFRNSNTFRNRLLMWNAAMRGRSSIADIHTNSDGGIVKLWLEGIVDYYKAALGSQLRTLGGDFASHVNASPSAREGTKHDARFDFGSSTVTAPTDEELEGIMERAQLCIKSDICVSPGFTKVLRLVPELLRSYRICDGLARSFLDSPSLESHKGGITASPDQKFSAFDYVIEERMRSAEWLFFMFAMLLGSLRLHHLYATASPAAATSGITVEELRSTLQAIMDLLRLASTDRRSTTDAVNAASLRYVRTACMISFPPAKMLEMLEQYNTEVGKVLEQYQTVPKFTAAEYMSQPLYRMFTKDIPELTAKMEDFISSATVERSWVTTVMIMQLFRFDPKKPRNVSINSSAAKALDVIGVRSNHMVEYEVSKNVQFRDSFLFALLKAYLRPLMRQLLQCEAPRAAEEDESDDDKVGARAGAMEKDAGNFAFTKDQMEAHQALVALARAVERIVIPRSSKMRRWNLVGVGDQTNVDERFGEACMKEAIKDVLDDMMVDILVWVTQSPSQWAAVLASKDKKRVIADTESVNFFKYLIRTEKFYNALTDSSVLVGKPGTAETGPGPMADAGSAMSIAIGLLQRYKRQYYEAVAAALDTVYPANASLALILPIVNATHTYLLRQEEAHGKSGAAGAAGAPVRTAPRPAGGPKAAPPAGAPGLKRPAGAPPSMAVPPVELHSEEEFKSALRLVQSIGSIDLFFSKYRDMLKHRLQFRPPPNRTQDKVFDATKRQLERGALEYLSACITEHSDLKAMRAMADAFAPIYFSSKNEAGEEGAGTKLVSALVDWRAWRIEDERQYLTRDNGTAPHLVDMGKSGLPLQSEPLPFPSDLWAALSEYQTEYQGTHNGKVLRWYAPERSQSSFTLAFPKDSGRVITIHGSMLLQQIIYAISQYRREGVTYATLAGRPGAPTADDLRKILRPLVDRDRLLVVLNKGEVPANSPAERLALNYDFVCPPQNRTGEYSYWLGCKRAATAVDEDEQREMRTRRITRAKVVIVQVMKSVRTCSHEDLFEKVSEKLSKEFKMSVNYFKHAIEDLIEQKFLERDGEAGNAAAYKYLA